MSLSKAFAEPVKCCITPGRSQKPDIDKLHVLIRDETLDIVWSSGHPL